MADFTEEKIEEKLNDVAKKFDSILTAIKDYGKNVQDKLKDFSEDVQIHAMLAQDKAEDGILDMGVMLEDLKNDAKGNLAALQENTRIAAERAGQKLNSEAIRMQMEVTAAEEDLKKRYQEAKEANDKAELERLLKDTLDYADTCFALSQYAAAEGAQAYEQASALAELLEKELPKED